MNKKRVTINITQGIAVMLLLIVVSGAPSISTTNAQSAILEEPYFVEKGMITTQKEIGPNSTQYTYTSTGMMNDNIEVIDRGEFLSVSKGNNLTFDRGNGVITTKDGSETANYTWIDVFNGTDFQGASAYSTNSTGKLSFLNNIIGIYKGEVDENENYVEREWHWK